MRKGLQNILEGKQKNSGNYKRITYNSTVLAIFFTTSICGYDREKQIFFADNRGFNTRSTNRAVKDAKSWCENKGYTEVSVDYFQEVTNVECFVGTYKW